MKTSYKPDFLERITQRRAALRADVAALLPAPRPIVWEIGSGHGHFLVGYAQQHPEKYCLGVDIQLERLERSGKKRDRARLANCHFLRAEAREFYNVLPAGVTLAEIWVLFPDPWPKARHNKNRLLKPEFFEGVAGRAGEGARIYFRTDHLEYFREVESALRTLATWKTEPGAPWPEGTVTVFQERAPSYHSLVAVRTSHPAKPVEIVAPGLPRPASPTSPG